MNYESRGRRCVFRSRTTWLPADDEGRPTVSRINECFAAIITVQTSPRWRDIIKGRFRWFEFSEFLGASTVYSSLSAIPAIYSHGDKSGLPMIISNIIYYIATIYCGSCLGRIMKMISCISKSQTRDKLENATEKAIRATSFPPICKFWCSSRDFAICLIISAISPICL